MSKQHRKLSVGQVMKLTCWLVWQQS